jgi:hypothetical protein
MAQRSWRRAGSTLAWLALVLTCALPVASGVVAPLGRLAAASAAASTELDGAVGRLPAVLDRVHPVGHIAQAVHRWDDGTTRGRPALSGTLAGVALLAALLIRPATSTARRSHTSHVSTASRGRAPPLAVLPG